MTSMDEALEHLDVSRETLARLTIYVDELKTWQKSMNLVSPDTLPDLWTRHVVDCAQLIRLAPEAKTWADLGSGAGLPGMIVGILLSGQAGGRVYLVESNKKKTAFLRHVKHLTGAAVDILPDRIETPAVQSRIANVDIVTARALASLSDLFEYSQGIMSQGARALFMKGQSVEREIQAAEANWVFEFDRHVSVSDSASTIVDVRSLSRKREASPTEKD